MFEIPVIGGRARGEVRPRAPSVGMHADGRERRYSLLLGNGGTAEGEQSRGVRKVLLEEEREMRSWEVVDEGQEGEIG